ncbi:MAG: helix-turn-helix domain-containing protein [Chryseobacterium sp.]|uniref:helix-turn-helix domain-containing protein n=1 Tax=Chryseobacterium sp. TaxID=1871047 RepID=UPI0025C07D9E|nr:helix-turn-helix domain-containing protein [Chryseobacterium sp.]MCJ7934259.1 helix-turn-helix domain-containing protein [Chryseobacterium sp.]
MGPDYQQIYTDILQEKYPEKLLDPAVKHKLEKLYSAVDILNFNRQIFGKPEYAVEFNNQRLRSYDKKSVLKILTYQKKNSLTNVQVSNHFKISRNTIAKWKLIFKV